MSLTKEDLISIESIVSGSINSFEQRLRRDLASKADLERVESRLLHQLAKKADKADVDRMEFRVVAALAW